MISKLRSLISICFTFLIFGLSQQAYAQNMADYTAYPPFVTSAVEPNILLVLDHSGSMQWPAYMGCPPFNTSGTIYICDSSDSLTDSQDMYKTSDDDGNEYLYYGYFKSDKYYKYDIDKFKENDACVYTSEDAEYLIGSGSDCISGNVLNWSTMSRIDLLRKVLIGGKSISEVDGIHTLRGEGSRKTYSDHNLQCTFTLSGGDSTNLDHVLSISDYGVGGGTCGYLTVWSKGSSIWNTSDSFRYIHQSMSGDFDVKLRIVSPPTESGAGEYAKAGLMVRASTAADSAHIMLSATNSNGLQFAYRSSTGGGTDWVTPGTAMTYPVWVRLVRSGDNFTGYYSSDGTAWTNYGNIDLPNIPTNNIKIGLNVASYNSSLLGSGEYDEFICEAGSACTGDNFDDEVFNSTIWSADDIGSSGGSQIESCDGRCLVGNITDANIQIDVPSIERRGIIQNLSDTNYDGEWDDDSPRFGLMVFAGNQRLGLMRVGIATSDMSFFMSELQDEIPYHSTPTAEALYEASDYYRQQKTNAFDNGDNDDFIGTPGGELDPLYVDGETSECRKNFVLLISDGEWNGNKGDPVIPAHEYFTNDIRTGACDIPGDQFISTYSVYTFSDDVSGRNAMQQVAMYGDHDHLDDNLWPYPNTSLPSNSKDVTLPYATKCNPSSLPMDKECIEWDETGPSGTPDGIPDNYYEAQDGRELEGQLMKAISDVLKGASSGTAVSVLSTTGEGEGAVYQAYFYPEKLNNLDKRQWLGYIQALFVDEFGNLREDTDGNAALDLKEDYKVEMTFTEELGTQIYRYKDTDGDGKAFTLEGTVELDDINTLWNGGKLLWQMEPDDRKIFTSTDGYNLKEFTIANSADLESNLRAADSTESGNIINWVRGADMTGISDAGHASGYRSRGIEIDDVTHEWKLGDIVHSTPSVVGRPMEDYAQIYGDASFLDFEKANIKRRNVVYTGANDGMLHAFNAGYYSERYHAYCTGPVDSGDNCTSGTYALGEELWSFIPRGLLPHLKWATQPDYTHVYYVDQKPKITDVKIFNDSWGTILIGGFRFGGKSINYTGGSASPEYFALDITDPTSPRLLWTFSHKEYDFGLSMSYPSVAKIGDKWFVIFGGGATNFDDASNLTDFQKSYITVLQISGTTDGVIDTWIEGTNYWKIPTDNATSFLANSITVDFDFDYNVDSIYIGENYEVDGIWNAVMNRITTAQGTVDIPSSWVLSPILDINTVAGTKDKANVITAAPSAAKDDREKLWLFFGTGQFYGLDDKNPDDTGGFYGVKDGCWKGDCITEYDSLIDTSNSTVNTERKVTGISTSCGTTDTWSGLISAIDACDGWATYFGDVGESLDYNGNIINHEGERLFTKPLVIGGIVAWASYIPGTDVCSTIGESNAYAVYYKTGTSYYDFLFDDERAKYVNDEPGDPSTPPPVVEVGRAINIGEGMPSAPSAQVDEDGGVTIFFQTSTGAIVTISYKPTEAISSGIEGWRNEHIE